MFQLQHDPAHPLLFHTSTFVVLFILFIVVHGVLSGHNRARLVLLLSFSLYYYWRSNGLYTLCLIGLATIDWTLSK